MARSGSERELEDLELRDRQISRVVYTAKDNYREWARNDVENAHVSDRRLSEGSIDARVYIGYDKHYRLAGITASDTATYVCNFWKGKIVSVDD